MKKSAAAFLCFFFLHTLSAQIIKVKPYLQDASPHSIFILWETDSDNESTVEYGLTADLGNTATGTAQTTVGTARLHEVELENLDRFTRYYYRVKTGVAVSDIYEFKTPPFASDAESFRMVAMSDMQRDGSFPDKFREIAEDGVIDFLTQEIGGELTDNLALVMIPGDLVVNGNNYASWENTFFTPSENLFSRIPVYPVPGNHENNADFFFQYFKLPDNGTPGFAEHWWHKDYGNVRMIGLDSNGGFTGQEQLDWLQNTLTATCAADSIDFVFAQLHHPHKSELWTPGESNFTGEVIEILEQFTADCGKPSLHFFGHTHGYSRGDSRDHKHLWINAATAGGAIDNWGEFPNADYPEFSVSQDEYGFVLVEITDSDDPQIVLKRIGRGDQDVVVDNELRDSIVIKLIPDLVNIPSPQFPVNEEVVPECVTLEASIFSAPNAAARHGQSHWQVSLAAEDFTNPAAESWKKFENWYFEQNTQAEDDLTDEDITGLAENTNYFWRVRYRDRELNWSDWSAPAAFSTGESALSPNLLINPGAENDLAAWTTTEGIVETLTTEECNGISPFAGEQYFAVGGLCEESEIGRCVQDVNVVPYADSIDTGSFAAHFGGYLANFSGSDLPEMRLLFLNENGEEIGTSETLSSLAAAWTLRETQTIIPAETRIIRTELTGTRNAGTDNDSYFDELFLRLGGEEVDCSREISAVNIPVSLRTLQVVPNPVRGRAAVVLPRVDYDQVSLHLVHANGLKIACAAEVADDKLYFSTEALAKGTYFFVVRAGKDLVGEGKVVVL